MKIINKLLSGRFLALVVLVVAFVYVCMETKEIDYLNNAVMLALGYYFSAGAIKDNK